MDYLKIDFLLDMVDFQCNVGSLPEDIKIEIYQLVDWILCYKQKMVQVLRVRSLGLGVRFMSLPVKTKQQSQCYSSCAYLGSRP